MSQRRTDSSLYKKDKQRRTDSTVQHGGAINLGAIGSALMRGATSNVGQQVIGNILGPTAGALGDLIAKKISGQGLRLAGQRGVGLSLAGRGKKKMTKRK